MPRTKKVVATEEKDPDWMYKPILNGAFSTRTDYDGNSIEFEHMLEVGIE